MLKRWMRAVGHLALLRFGVRDRLIRWIHNPDTAKSEEFAVPFFGLVYRGNFDTFIDWSVYYYGAYAREELRLMEDLLVSMHQPVVMDIGANVGHHTLFASRKAKHVLAFEPFFEVANKLRQKLLENAINNVRLFEFALGEKNEKASYKKPKGHNTGTGSFISFGNDNETLDLEIRIGDEVLEQNAIKDVHFIKIDTEGFEPHVLNGLAKTLVRCRPIVFFEWSQGVRGQLDHRLSTIFPQDYTFYLFVPDIVVFKLFRKMSYRLAATTDHWPDGNLLAMPIEAMVRLKNMNPKPAVLEKIEKLWKIA